MDMISRLLLAALLVSSAALADPLDLTPKSFRAGMTKHLAEMPDCADAKLDAPNPMRDGSIVLHELKSDDASVDIMLQVDQTGKLSEAKFTGPESPKNDPQLQLMMCATYAIMRTLQPQYETPAQASKNVAHVWKSAANKPFKMAFYFNTIDTRLLPFEMVVH